MADCAHSTPSSAGHSAATPALRSALAAAANWAQASNCSAALQLVVGSCLIYSEHAHWLGTPLHFLRNPFVAQRLERWRHDAPEIEALQQLSAALQLPDAADLLEENQPLPSEVPARQQFHGTLGWSYVVAALTTASPSRASGDAITHWFMTMQTWLLVHAAVRATRNDVPFDSNLAKVSNMLRQASQSDPDWLAFIHHLCRPLPDDWLSINRHLIRRTEHLLPDYPPGTKRDALRALCDAAKLEFSPPKELPEYLQLLLKAQPLKAVVSLRSEQPTSPSEDERDAQVVVLDTLGDPNQPSEPLASVAVAPDESPRRQLREARSILLFSREESQFLPYSWHRLSSSELDALEHWIGEAC